MINWDSHSANIAGGHGSELPAATRIRHILMAAITRGDLPPGARIKEVEIGEALGVSRTPLREAISALRAEGIMEAGEEGGLRVRKLDYRDIHELYEMRATLEGMAARLAARQATECETNFILETHADEERLIANNADAADLAQHNSKFHNSILLATHNNFLIDSLQRIATILVLLGPTAYSLATRVSEIAREHSAMNDAIQRRDENAADAAARAHLMQAVKARLRIMAEGNRSDID